MILVESLFRTEHKTVGRTTHEQAATEGCSKGLGEYLRGGKSVFAPENDTLTTITKKKQPKTLN